MKLYKNTLFSENIHPSVKVTKLPPSVSEITETGVVQPSYTTISNHEIIKKVFTKVQCIDEEL